MKVSPGFFLAGAALLWLDPELLLPAALAAFLHESGHLAALRVLGRRVRRLRLTAGGLALEPDGPLSYRQELPAALAGPAVSLLAAFLAARWGFFLFAGVSLALGAFNLLPVLPLDGGRAFRAACALLLPAHRSLGVSRWTGVAVGGAALGLAAALFTRLGGVPLLLAGLWLARQGISGEKDT